MREPPKIVPSGPCEGQITLPLPSLQNHGTLPVLLKALRRDSTTGHRLHHEDRILLLAPHLSDETNGIGFTGVGLVPEGIPLCLDFFSSCGDVAAPYHPVVPEEERGGGVVSRGHSTVAECDVQTVWVGPSRQGRDVSSMSRRDGAVRWSMLRRDVVCEHKQRERISKAPCVGSGKKWLVLLFFPASVVLDEC